jgi:excisionase family DNA binding protein
MAAADSPLLTIPEVQRRLRCGRSYVYELMVSGALPSLKLGRRLVPTTAVEKFLNERLAENGLTPSGPDQSS